MKTKKLIFVITLLVVNTAIGQTTANNPTYNKSLAQTLENILESDQKHRQDTPSILAKHGRDSDEFKKHVEETRKTDAENLSKVKKILDTYGWLGPKEVGSKGNTVLFLVIQHASEITTREKYLPMLRKAVKEKKAHPAHLAMLEDRIAVGRGRLQIYGSQLELDKETNTYFVSPLKDPENVDKIRTAIGLQPMAEYLKTWNLKWDLAEYKKMLPKILRNKEKQRLKGKTGWVILYSNDKKGNATKGLKENLMNAVRNGCEIRIGWGLYGKAVANGKEVIFSVEHLADTNFLTISNDEIFAQIKPIMGQAPAMNEPNISLIETTQWQAIFSTTGKLNQIFLDKDPKRTQKATSRVNTHWYVNKNSCSYEKNELKHLY